MGGMPILTSPRVSPRSSPISCSAAFRSAKMRRAWGRKISPSAVSDTLLSWRLKRTRSSSSSSFLIDMLTAGWAMRSPSAALVKLLTRATSRKYLSCRTSTPHLYQKY